MSLVSVLRKKLTWRSLLLGLFLSFALAFVAYKVYAAYIYTLKWEDHFTTDPLAAWRADCGKNNDGPGPTGWSWYQAPNSADRDAGRKGCIKQTNGTEVLLHEETVMKDGPDLYRQDLKGTLQSLGISKSNYRIDVRVKWTQGHGYGVGVNIMCQKKFSYCPQDLIQGIAFMGLVYGNTYNSRIFDFSVADANVGGNRMYHKYIARGAAVADYIGRWHRLSVYKYGGNTYLCVDIDDNGNCDYTHTSTNTNYWASTMFFGDPTVQAAGDWTRIKSHYVRFYQVDSCSVPGKPTLSAPGCTNDSTPTWSWSASSGGCAIDNYEVDRSWAANFTTTSTSYTPTLGTGSYWIKVRAHNSAGWGPWSDAKTVQVDLSAPPTPSLNSPANNICTTDTTPTLTVNSVSDVGCKGGVQYQIVLDDDPNFGSLNWNSGWQAGTSYTGAALGFGTYYWRTRARDGFGFASGWSGSRSLTVNGSPSNGTVSPASGCSGAGVVRRFTTTHTDPNGYNNIQYVHLLLNDRVDGRATIAPVGAFYGYYNLNNNHFYIRNDANTAWIDLGVTGSLVDRSNSYVTLKSTSSRSVSGNTLTVYWDLQFKSGWTENVNAYLYTRDDCNAIDGWEDKGNYGIDTTGPNAPSVTGDSCWAGNPSFQIFRPSDPGCSSVNYYRQYRAWDGNWDYESNTNASWWYTVPNPPTTTTDTYFRAYARDAIGNWGSYTQKNFSIDVSAPPTPTLNSPADGSNTTDTTPTLTVNSVSDVGCNGSEEYQIVVDDDPNFGSVDRDSGGDGGTGYTVSPALAPGTYYWRARVRDGFANTSDWSASRSFTIVATGSISGRVWNSTGDDYEYVCAHEPVDLEYADSQITIRYRLCEDWDPNFPSCSTTTSLVDGSYSFSNVPADRLYTVEIVESSLPSGWTQTTAACFNVYVPSDEPVNFGISSNPHAWIQGISGDIYGNGIAAWVVKDPPGVNSNYYRWFLATGLPSDPFPTGGGVVISGDPDPSNLTCGGGGDPGRCSQRPGGTPGWHVTGEAMAWRAPDTSKFQTVDITAPIQWGNLDPNKVYRRTSETHVNVPGSYDLSGDGVAIIYIQNNDLIFETSLKAPASSYTEGIIFIVENGKVTIPQNVREINALVVASAGTRSESGTITIEGNNVANNLTVLGMLHAESGFSFNRTLTDNTIPAVVVEYNPLYLYYPNPLLKPQIFWKEVSP